MQNNTRFYTALLILIPVALLVGALFLIKGTSTTREESAITPNETVVVTPPVEDNVNVDPSTTPLSTWKSSSLLNFYYPEGFEASEFAGDTPEFRAENGKLIISWSMTPCAESEMDPFVLGVSAVACIRDRLATIGVSDVRDALTTDDLKIFGAFVLKNK